MKQKIRVLIAEDCEADAELLKHDLERGGYDIHLKRVETREAFKKALLEEEWDMVFSDYTMPSFNALDALDTLRETAKDLPFIIVSGSIGETLAVEAMKAGAHDYVLKGNTLRLVPVVQRELREAIERRQRKRAEDTVLHLAYHDSLTDLPNRLYLRARLAELLSASDRGERPLALLFIDLDRFKEVNDTLGHQRGDALLQMVSRRIQRALSAGEPLMRLGGDEFAILLPLADEGVAQTVARKILGALEDPFLIDEMALVVNASIGIALYPKHGTDADTLIQRADVAMYQAKASLNGLALYDSAKDQYSPERLGILTELREAGDRGQIFLVYQPQVHLQTGTICGAEALVRWRHPHRGILGPDQFITLSERTGLIRSLTSHILRQAIDQASLWRQAGLSFPVSVNLSTRNLEDVELPSQIDQLLRIYKLTPAYLKIEITENTFLSDSPEIRQVLTRLHGMGLELVIDDFGTGFSSLAHLKRLPIGTLKIDKSFVEDMESDAQTGRMVRSVIALAHSLSMKVTAEGIETERTLAELRGFDCDAAQGHFVSPPLEADAFSRWASAHDPRKFAAPRGKR